MPDTREPPPPGLPTTQPAARRSWAWYRASIANFLASDPAEVLGRLSEASAFDIDLAQRGAWVEEIGLLRSWLAGRSGELLLEFTIPRLGSRIDAVLLIGPAVFVVEFKVNAQTHDRSAVEQTWDYALDLKNFHEASHAAPIVPLLVATAAAARPPPQLVFDEDGVCRPLRLAPDCVPAALDAVLARVRGSALDAARWANAPYRPTPTIIEAARALYARHSVEDITRNDAGAVNLAVTSRRIEALVEDARREDRKAICFVTGVPGAGKTLVGLDVATRKRDAHAPTHAVFLSGNGPLVAVLREALTRDEVARRRAAGERTTKTRVANPVKAFIQNVHHFRDAALLDEAPPADHVVIFDEAQRAWTREKTAQFMKQRKGLPDFRHSEPEFLISCLDRHPDWAFIVCLVGGGQEIHTGEAGIGEWLEACRGRFRHWDLHLSDRLTDSEYAAGETLQALRGRPRTHFDEALHLAVDLRSFRAENISRFVKALLDCDRAAARREYGLLAGRFPLAVTRDLQRAKQWLRGRARGSERFGLVASSKAMRLKPHAIDIRVAVDPVQWFLSEREDTRSSYYLEDVATEFQVQGLELDWTCVTWDADLRHDGRGWSFHDFRGSRWERIHQQVRQHYLRNAYRVLLTRARQGMVLFVPPGDPTDPTREPGMYDATFRYLREVGVPVLE